MSAPITEPTTTEPTTAADPAPVMGEQETDWKAEAEKWKALSRKHEDASKANAGKAKLYDDATEAAKTEQQKLADKLAAAERVAAEAVLKATRAEVAQAKGVPAALLSGDSLEALEASADALLIFRGEAPKPPVVPPADGQGNVGDPVNAKGRQFTRADLQSMTPEQIEAARVAGQLDALLSGKTT